MKRDYFTDPAVTEKPEVAEEPINTVDMKYDERLEGYYVVTSSAVNIRPTPSANKKDKIVKCLLNGEKFTCDGKYTLADGKKWLHVNSGSSEGFVIDRFAAKL